MQSGTVTEHEKTYLYSVLWHNYIAFRVFHVYFDNKFSNIDKSV